jgi:hypothetical protein
LERRFDAVDARNAVQDVGERQYQCVGSFDARQHAEREYREEETVSGDRVVNWWRFVAVEFG